MTDFTHLNERGEATMVDVADKPNTIRRARAQAQVCMQPQTLQALETQALAKGDVLGVARIAGITAAKKTADLIPLCHPLALTKVVVDFSLQPPNRLRVIAEARVTGQTGVEMEALTAASVAALTVYDMCKAIDRSMSIEHVQLLTKSGGRSGDWQRDSDSAAHEQEMGMGKK